MLLSEILSSTIAISNNSHFWHCKTKQNLTILKMPLSHSLESSLNLLLSMLQDSLHLYIKKANTRQQVSKIQKAESELFNTSEWQELSKIIYKDIILLYKTAIRACVNQPMYCYFWGGGGSFWIFPFFHSSLSSIPFIFDWKKCFCSQITFSLK